MMDLHSQGSKVKKALQERVRLDDGRYGYVITELVPAGSVPRWHCHVCGKTISSERSLHIHLSHPVHSSNLRVSKHPPSNFKKFSNEPYRSPRESDDSSWVDHTTDVLPGEPVPPGMEDLVEGCQIQKTLDAFKSAPLIGLEYIVELVSSSGEGEPRYACLLCEKRGDPRSVIVHLTSQNHYLKYISCFFRSAGNALNMQQRTPEIRKGIYVAINKVAEQIEKHYGRLKPISAIAETFSAKKYEILREIDEKEHFRETPETSFLDLVHPDKIKKYAIEEEHRLKSQLIKVEVPTIHSKHDKGSKTYHCKVPPPLTNPPKKTPPPLTNPPKKVPPPLPNPAKVVPPLNKNQPAKDIKSDKKLVFQIGKPEKSFGRNKASDATKNNDQTNNQEDDDDVIFVGDNIGECIEVKSLSSISSTSDNGSPGRDSLRRRRRSRSIDRFRRRSPDQRGRRRSPSYNSYNRSRRSRSNSRDRNRQKVDRRYRRSRSRRRYDDYSEERERRKTFSRDRSLDRRRSPPRRRDKSPERKKIRNDWQSRADRSLRWDKYRAELKKLEMEFDDKLKYYEDRPEKHPSYSEEWKNYWNKKYKEIQQTGKDPSNYDFKPEWIVFWGKRMKEINETEFEKRREELTKEYGVEGIRAKGPSSELQDISPPTPDDAKDVTVADIRNTWKALTGSEISGPPDKEDRRPLSPWENDKKFYDKPYEKHNKKYNSPSFPISTPVVHCLRMLSVLENQLGSLGPRVLDLLSQALALERNKEGESMVLLEDRDNHIFFDTVKEKVRGHLLAGIVERGLVNSCYSIIGAIENMLRTNPYKPKRPVTKSPLPPKEVINTISEPVQVHGIGMIDKIAVAQQIAGALIAQGKTDVTQEELEGLINAVVGIAKASNATVNQDTSTVDFFSQLNLKNSTANSHINELLGNMISTVQKTTVPSEPAPPPPPLSNPEPLPPEPENKATEKEDNDEDLKEKLMNFSNLPREEQQDLIAMLKGLESTQPERVEGLRKYVTIGLEKKAQSKEVPKDASPRQETTDFEQDDMEQVNNVPSDDEDDDDDYSFEDVYKAASEKLKTKEPSQEKINYNTFEDSNSRGSRLSTKIIPDHSEILADKEASQMSISSDRAVPLDDFFSKNLPMTRPPFPPNMNSRLSFTEESNFGGYGQQNMPYRGESSNFGFPNQEPNQFNQSYPPPQNWNYAEQVQYPPPVPPNQFVPGNQNFPPMNFNQQPPTNFGNYYGNY